MRELDIVVEDEITDDEVIESNHTDDNVSNEIEKSRLVISRYELRDTIMEKLRSGDTSSEVVRIVTPILKVGEPLLVSELMDDKVLLPSNVDISILDEFSTKMLDVYMTERLNYSLSLAYGKTVDIGSYIHSYDEWTSLPNIKEAIRSINIDNVFAPNHLSKEEMDNHGLNDYLFNVSVVEIKAAKIMDLLLPIEDIRGVTDRSREFLYSFIGKGFNGTVGIESGDYFQLLDVQKSIYGNTVIKSSVFNTWL